MDKFLTTLLSALSLASLPLKAQETDLSFIDDFKQLKPHAWDVADYDFSHPHFDTDWRKSNVVFGHPLQDTQIGLLLKIVPNSFKISAENRFLGGSIRRKIPTHYGRYESMIQPAKGDGFVTGFFTYTGPYYGTTHDEIDIEFLGKNTNQIHIAWFKDGVLKNKLIDLSFDASERPRLYSFEWLPDRINWFVEDTLIFSAEIEKENLPDTPSMLFANVWAADPSISNWAGTVIPNQSGAAWFGDVKFTPHHLLSQVKITD